MDAVVARIPLERDVQVLRTLHYRLGMLQAEFDVGAAIKSFQRALGYRSDDAETLAWKLPVSDVAVYDGSMSEWVQHPELPLTLGSAP